MTATDRSAKWDIIYQTEPLTGVRIGFGTFFVPEDPEAMVSQVTPISTEQPSVMVVEDERVALRAMSLLLSACGYRTQAYASAEEALRNLACQGHPRLALVDFDLPGMNGLDLIRRLADLDPAIIPILITATDPETIQSRLQWPVTYLRKPVNFDRLLDILGRPQASHPALSERR